MTLPGRVSPLLKLQWEEALVNLHLRTAVVAAVVVLVMFKVKAIRTFLLA